MAELDFSHHVSEIPAGGAIPTVERHEQVHTNETPDVQSAASHYAAATNWMSMIGSAVASKASTAIATKLGNEWGKNPHGDIGIPITDFDKTVTESYQTQSQATLGIQAQKLISQSNLELAAMPRLNAATIAKAQQKISLGLNNIYKLAPSNIQPQLELQYNSLLLSQNEHLVHRMIEEHKEDRKNTYALSSKLYTQNAYTLPMSGVDIDKNGDSVSGLAAVESVRRSSASAAANRDITPLEAQVATESAEQSYLSGKITRLGLIAQREGKLAEFEKTLADNPEKYGIEPKDHAAVINNFTSYMASQKGLRSEQENLVSQELYNRIITDPTAITGSDMAAFKSQVSPLKYAEMEFKLIQARQKKIGNETAINQLMANYGDSRAQALAKPEIKDAVFERAVQQTIKSNPTLTLADAEIQVASTAGAPPPAFTKGIRNGLWSGDATQMLERAKQIDDLQSSGNGHALNDLSEADKALASDISHNNNPADPAWAARMITENKENQDETVRKNTQQALSNHIYQNATKNNVSVDDWILGKFSLTGGMFHQGFDSPWMKGKYASDILSVYSQNFINTRGDTVRTDALTQEHIKANYGQTRINGKSEFTKHPIEKACGFNEGEGVGAINKDILRQLQEPLTSLKQAYDEHKSNEYWTIEEVGAKNVGAKLPIGIYRPAYGITQEEPGRIHFTKHTRNGVSTDTETYPLKLVGNNFNWELNVETDHGPMSIFLASPQIGVHKYTPDIKWIQDEYQGKSHLPYFEVKNGR